MSPWRFWPRRKKIPRITLRVTPGLATVSPGESASSTLEVEMTEVKASVALSANNVPSWAMVTFNPSGGTPPFKSEMVVSTTLEAPPGTHTMFIVAEGGGVREPETYVLMVRQEAPAAEKASAVSG